MTATTSICRKRNEQVDLPIRRDSAGLDGQAREKGKAREKGQAREIL